MIALARRIVAALAVRLMDRSWLRDLRTQEDAARRAAQSITDHQRDNPIEAAYLPRERRLERDDG